MTKTQMLILTVMALVAILIFCVLGLVFVNMPSSPQAVSEQSSERVTIQAVEATPKPTATLKPTATRGPTSTPTPKPLKLLDTFEGTGYDEFKLVILGPGQFYLEVESERIVEMAMYGPVKKSFCIDTASELKTLLIKGGARIEHEAPTYYSYPIGYCIVVGPFGITEMDYKTYSAIPWTVKFMGNVDY